MAFDSLSSKLQDIFSKLTSRGKLTEADVKAAMREVKLALLEADVNFKVVKELIASITEKAVGAGVMNSLTPGQQVIKIVNEELTTLLGGVNKGINFNTNGTTVVMMCGLQGAGKTTMCGKLAQTLKKQGKNVLLVACDIYRPAAVKQLEVVAKGADVEFFSLDGAAPEDIARAAVAKADRNIAGVVLLDTAGRLHIDGEMMEELKRVKAAVKPHETLLVLDAMTGQDAVNAASEFNAAVGIDGVVLTKLDGDSRGGAAISVKAVTGKPIKFIGTGEKLADVEAFHPERMASRILGMGDVLTLIEKAQASYDEDQAKKLEAKIKNADLTLDDFLEQMQQMRDMGGMEQMLSMLPGGKKLSGLSVDEKAMKRTEAIIKSMTPEERRRPYIIDGSRRKRISAGSGTSVQEVNRLLNQFEQTKKLLKGMSGKKGKRMGFPGLPF